MEVDWTTVLSAFVGAFLASGTGYVFELRRVSSRLSNGRKLLKIAIQHDLNHALTVYDKIADEFEKTQTVWFSTLNEVRESRFTYHNNKDWIHVIDDENLRRRIFRHYLQSTDRVNNLEFQQRRKYEITAKLNDAIRDIKIREPEIDHDSTLKRAVGYMESENAEYQNLLQAIPDSVNKLSQFKTEAQDILRRLDNV